METIEELIKTDEIKKIVNYFAKTNRRIFPFQDGRQEAYLCLIKAYRTYRPQVGIPFKSWFYRITLNKFASFRRKKEKENLLIINPEPLTRKNLELLTINHYLSCSYDEIINNKILSKRERRILKLRYCKSCTLKEIGIKLGVSKQWARNVLNGILIKLKNNLLSNKNFSF